MGLSKIYNTSWSLMLDEQKAALDQAGSDKDDLIQKQWDARKARLDLQINEIYSWYDNLGWFGIACRGLFKSANCLESLDRIEPTFNKNTRAVSSAYDLKYGFQNSVWFGLAALQDKDLFAIFDAHNHEMTHMAKQYRDIAAAHATPWNKGTRVVLCPRDAMILNVLMERQAFAVQAVLGELARDADAGTIGFKNLSDFEAIKSRLKAYAQKIDCAQWAKDEAFVKHYRRQAQDYYEGGHAEYLKKEKIGYARLGIDDLRAINEFLGIKMFGDTDEELLLLLGVTFDAEETKRLETENEDLGVPSYETLPVLTDALVAQKITPRQFINAGLGIFAKPARNKIKIVISKDQADPVLPPQVGTVPDSVPSPA